MTAGPPPDTPRIPPHSKDWTWVLDRACPECGLDTRTVAPGDVASRLRACAQAWESLLMTTPAPAARVRPTPDRWSLLEYGCHVRDVFTIFGSRLDRMLGEDGPAFS